MRDKRNPYKSFLIAALFAPALFALGLYLYYRDRTIGEPYTVEEGGVLGLATNLSLIGLTAIVRFFIAIGPQLMILIGIALPVCGALYAIERLDSRRSPINPRKRTTVWVVACAESLGMMALFMFAINQINA